MPPRTLDPKPAVRRRRKEPSVEPPQIDRQVQLRVIFRVLDELKRDLLNNSLESHARMAARERMAALLHQIDLIPNPPEPELEIWLEREQMLLRPHWTPEAIAARGEHDED